jgi:hypothetical protein
MLQVRLCYEMVSWHRDIVGPSRERREETRRLLANQIYRVLPRKWSVWLRPIHSKPSHASGERSRIVGFPKRPSSGNSAGLKISYFPMLAGVPLRRSPRLNS